MKSKAGTPPKVASNRLSRSGAEAEVAELRRELHEAHDQQTAASEVLRVISRSSGDLQPVFDAMLANATRLSDATFGTLWLYEVERDPLAVASVEVGGMGSLIAVPMLKGEARVILRCGKLISSYLPYVKADAPGRRRIFLWKPAAARMQGSL